MKNPNGFGTVTKLSGNRRKPWVVKVTIGYDEHTGKQIQKSIGTFASRPEVLQQLYTYNAIKDDKEMIKHVDHKLAKNIKDKAKVSHTFIECVWASIEAEKEGKSKQWLACKKTFIKLLSDLHDKDITKLDLFTMQACIDKIRKNGKSKVTLNGCKTVCVKAFEYAVIHQYIGRLEDYTSYIKVISDAEPKFEHKPFTRNEINIILKDKDLWAKIVIVYILTGCRARELTNVERHEGYMVCGSKTKNGKNRKIPIHSYIAPFIDEVLDALEGKTYNILVYEFKAFMSKYNMDHRMHDMRYTFATIGKEAGIQASVIKKIMGHTLGDITEDIYTHESLDFFKQEIEKIKLS